jgi:hypothetical protein
MMPSTTQLTILRSNVSATYRRWRSMSRLDSCSGHTLTTSITCYKAVASERATSRSEHWKKLGIQLSKTWSRQRGPTGPIPSQRSGESQSNTQLPLVEPSEPLDLDTQDYSSQLSLSLVAQFVHDRSNQSHDPEILAKTSPPIERG